MDWAAVAGAIVGLVGGGAFGFLLGRRFRARCARGAFWAASAGSLVLGVLVFFLGEVVSLSLLAGGGIGLLTGGLNGLRWGMGKLSDLPRPPASAPPAAPQTPARGEDRTVHPAS